MTDTIEITLKLPADYVRDAEDFDMLNPETILHVLRQELDSRIMAFVDSEVKASRARELFEIIEEIQSIEPRITQEEIDAELEAYYAEKSNTKEERCRK